MGLLKLVAFILLIQTVLTATTGPLSTECGGKLFSTHGMLTPPSPSIPDNTLCLYTIATADPFYITATEIDTGLTTDVFKVSDIDGREYSAADLEKYNLYGSWFKVEFYTGATDSFQLEWDIGLVGCNKIINSTEGMLQSPGYPFHYRDNLRCSYNINAENVSTVIIDDLNTENGKDLLLVTSLDYSGEVEHMFYTGDSQHLVQIGRQFEILFLTDSSIGGRGFHLTWEPAPAISNETFLDADPHACSGYFMGLYGYLESPNYPSDYYTDSNCYYNIYSDQITDLVLEIEALKLAPEDYLVINATSYKDPLYYYSNYSMSGDFPPHIIKGTDFTIEFYNNGNDTATGYRFTWTPASVHVDPTHKVELGLRSCHEYFTAPYGSVSSPNYPKAYPNFYDCYYTINTTMEIELILDDMYIEDDYDNLEVKVHNGSEFVTLHKLTGHHKLKDNLRWTGEVFQIYFMSDSLYGKRGFRFVWRPASTRSNTETDQDDYGVEVFCSGTRMLVNIHPNATSQLFPGVDDSELTLADPSCASNVFPDLTQLYAPVMTCGMTREETETHIIYKNIIQVPGGRPMKHGSTVTKMDTPAVNVECSVGRETSGIGYYWPKHDDGLFLRGHGNFSVYMNLYLDSNRTDKFTTYPKPIELDQDVYVDIGLMTDDEDLMMAPKKCYAQPTLNRQDFTETYDLISNGCPAEESVSLEDSAHQNIYFRFRAFEFLRNKDEVYVVCYVTVCEEGDKDSKCRRDCNTNVTRRRRAVHNNDHDLYIFQGPLKIRSRRDVADASLNAGHSSSGIIPAAVMAVSAVAMVLAAVVIVVAKRRS